MIFLINFRIYFIFFKNFKNRNLINKCKNNLEQKNKFYFFFIKFNLIFYKIFYFFFLLILIFIVKYNLLEMSSIVYIDNNVNNSTFIFKNNQKVNKTIILKIITLLVKSYNLII